MWWQDTIRETEGKGSFLEKCPFFDWEPVKLFEKWFNMLMSGFAKNDFGCMILNFLDMVRLIRGDVNEQRLTIVQITENDRTHQLSCCLNRQEMANRANSSDR